MVQDHSPKNTRWKDTFLTFLHPRVVTMLFLGFSAGLPILLIFSSLSIWLREAGVERSVVTYFSWAALGYSFKFVWAPLVDTLKVPLLTDRLGRRRSWLLLSQLSVMVAIILMASMDPKGGVLIYLALASILLGFSSATQDIVIDAYRIESAGSELQAMMSSTYVAGYRIGMLLAGAGVLVMASNFGSSAEYYYYPAWQKSYFIAATFMLVGICTTLLINEPEHPGKRENRVNHGQVIVLFLCCVAGFILSYVYSGAMMEGIKQGLSGWLDNKALSGAITELLRLLLGLVVVWGISRLLISSKAINRETMETLYLEPVQEFFQRYGLQTACLMLLLIGLYRVSDIVLGVISNVFYYDLGFSKNQIAGVVKTFGLLMTLAGGFVGGILAVRFGVIRILLVGAAVSALTNLLFIALAGAGNTMWLLYLVIGADNLSAGLASAAFIAFLSALTNIRFTAMQYAIFSSLMTLLPKIIGGYSGSMVDAMGYELFFTATALMGVPVILLILYLRRHVEIEDQSQ